MGFIFSATVTDFWVPATTDPWRRDAYRVVVDPDLRDDLSLTLLDVVDGARVATLTPAAASALRVENGQFIAPDDLHSRMSGAGLHLNGADHVFYTPVALQDELVAHTPATGTRMLSAADSAEFERFCADAPDDDLDEAFVELDHWLAYGAFAGGRLVAVASMYPWRDTRLADLGVITLPAFRGRGIGRRLVRAISAEALRLGCEPQYRCQRDNLASVALAQAAGFRRFGDWDVVTA